MPKSQLSLTDFSAGECADKTAVNVATSDMKSPDSNLSWIFSFSTVVVTSSYSPGVLFLSMVRDDLTQLA